MSDRFKNLLKIGDTVCVDDVGAQYRRYYEMAEFFGITNWEYDRYIEKEDIFIVRGYHSHLINSLKTIVWVETQDGEHSYLIGIEGLKVIIPEFQLEEELFLI